MLRWILGGGVLIVVAIVGFVAWRMMMPPPDDLDLSRERMTEAGIYRVEIAPEIGPVVQGSLHSWVATVRLADGSPVEDARVSVDGGMPQHGHGLPTAPQATGHQGEGRYLIEGMRFNMGGWWELTLDIASPAGEDTVTFNLVIQ
ncbi:MAG: FixH family protein [Rhizobiaceae bacterium]